MTLKNYFFLFLSAACLVSIQGSGQSVSGKHFMALDKVQLEKQQDSLMPFADEIVNAPEPNQRFRADSFFIRLLVRSLKIPNSFYFPFDSLQTISKLYAPDSSFRIFTWQVKKDEYVYFQRGAIQMRTSDGSLKLFPLHDFSTFTAKPSDSVRSPNNWIGAIYYRIIQKKFNGKDIYTLLGFDDFTINSNKKWMEVLTFNEQGQPVFGGPYFSFKNDSSKIDKKQVVRFYIEYKKEAVTSFNYDTSLNMIIYDHLISESDEPNRKETFVPDGDYEGFTWQNGQWLHVPKVFNTTLQDGQFPTEKKILSDDGGINEELLKQQSEKNKKKAN
ncbi:MAG TPA: hypothetical protein VII44_04025 [Puia sp.]